MKFYYFIFALIVYLASLYLSEFVAENQVYHMIDAKPLFDRGHNLLPVLPQLYTNVLLYSLIGYFILRIGYQQNITILTNYLWMVTLLFMGRTILLIVTQLPPSLPECSTVKKGDPLHFKLLDSKWKECLDLMYSGHTIHATIIFLCILYMSPYTIEKVIIGLLTFLEYIFIIASRMHYTADVVVAMIVSTLTFLAWADIGEIKRVWYYGGKYGNFLKENKGHVF